MKAAENPPRLLEHPEFGRDWRAAAGEEVATERLVACGQGLAQQLASLQAAPIGTAASTGATVAKIVLPILAVCGLVSTYALLREPAAPEPPKREAPRQERGLAEPEAIDAAPEKPASPEPTRAKRVKTPSKPVRVAEPREPSALPAQLELFAKAKKAADDGDFTQALQFLAEIEEKHPDSAIDPEIRLARAEYLVRAERLGPATQELQKLLVNPALQGKRPALLHLLGDVWMKRGRCDRATAAYQKALAAGLRKEETAAVTAAMEKCRR